MTSETFHLGAMTVNYHKYGVFAHENFSGTPKERFLTLMHTSYYPLPLNQTSQQ